MKKIGILNAKLSGLIAALGHKDLVLIGDAGMPIPQGVEIVDLALCKGVPSFKQTLEMVLQEMEVEEYFLADEIKEKNPDMYGYVKEQMMGVGYGFMSHDDLKKMSAKAKFAIRTGEFSPYSNVILQAGVIF